MERIIKQCLQGVIAAMPYVIFILAARHFFDHKVDVCWQCILSLTYMAFGTPFLAEYLIKAYIVPAWNWIWSE